MTKDHAQGVFIRFIDFRGELLLRASAIDGVTPAGKNGADEATYVYLNGTRLLVELPYQTVREILAKLKRHARLMAMNPISKLFVWIQKLKYRKQIKGRCDGQRI